jgi:predicted TIM-barrel fold metal-dependent hydrolase
MIQRIDSHQHFWRPARGDYGWLRADVPAVAPLVRDFLPEHLAPLLQAHGVARTVLVQAAESEAETDFMLELATAHEAIGGVVGWVDLSRPDAAASLARMARIRSSRACGRCCRTCPMTTGSHAGRIPMRSAGDGATRPALRCAGEAAPPARRCCAS